MKPAERRPRRGRPPTITRQRIADVGIAMGLPNITFVGMATHLGVSHMALYKHIANLEDLKHLVAEEIFNRWQIPQTSGHGREHLQDYLLIFATAVHDFVKSNPGVTPYVMRRMVATQSMLDKITDHQRHIAETHAISMAQARWLLATIAFHSMTAANTVYSVAGQGPTANVDRTKEEAEMEFELMQGTQALIVGALVMLEDEHPLQA